MRRTIDGRKVRLPALVVGVLVLGSTAAGATDLATLVAGQRERVESLFRRLDLERPELRGVKQAYDTGNLALACERLLRHYEGSPWIDRLRDAPGHSGRYLQEADDVMRDVFTLQDLRAEIPRLPDGRFDWWSRGPKDDREWTVVLNWHLYFRSLLRVWEETGDARYAEAFAGLLTDWVLSNPPPAGKPETQPWRSLEAAMRLTESWPYAFFGFLRSADVPASAKILLLSSVPEQAAVCRSHHTTTGNHVLVEMLALARAALYWPEFRATGDWTDYAFGTTANEMTRQVNPDGTQKELSNHYQATTATNFDRLVSTAREAGRPLPDGYEERLIDMWDYMARVAKPSGEGPLNNDADRVDNARLVRDAAGRFGREDWRFMVGGGAEGVQPAGPASSHFPWAGHVVMRSGFKRDALWSFFDVGPSGQAHSHYDRLHLSVSALGRDFLVDTGRYHYKPDAYREYFVGPRSHNVMIVDGRRQPALPRVRVRPHDDGVVLGEAFDFARGSAAFAGTGPVVRHERAVLRYRDRYWLVIDHVVGFEEHEIETLWHFHPDCTVEARDGVAETVDAGQPNLSILPLGEPSWDLEVVSGRGPPGIQGWWSATYNEKLPAPTAVYRARERGPLLFGWLLVPRRPGDPPPLAEWRVAPAGIAHLRIHDGGSVQEIAIRLRGGDPLRLSDGQEIDADLAVVEDGRLLRGD
jgi:hypothetical protein